MCERKVMRINRCRFSVSSTRRLQLRPLNPEYYVHPELWYLGGFECEELKNQVSFAIIRAVQNQFVSLSTWVILWTLNDSSEITWAQNRRREIGSWHIVSMESFFRQVPKLSLSLTIEYLLCCEPETIKTQWFSIKIKSFLFHHLIILLNVGIGHSIEPVKLN